MLNNIIDRVGEWNPQLFRELKSRLSGTPLIAAIVTSIVGQSMLIGIFTSANSSFTDRAIGWFYILNWLVPTILVLGSVYTILTDIAKEEKTGTLNFIRLSPQSAREIFLGKILGVPSLVYVGLLITLPLHIIIGTWTGANPLMMLVWYGTIISIAYFCASLTIIAALNHIKYAIVWTLALFIPLNSVIALYNANFQLASTTTSWWNEKYLLWYWVPIVNNFYIFSAFIIATLLLMTHWLWVTIDRRYINATSTKFKKADSYWMNLQFQLWLLGFALPTLATPNKYPSDDKFYVVAFFYAASTVWIFCLASFLLPARQSVRDWSQSHHALNAGKYWRWRQPEIIEELIWHERSPILVAMAINLAIAAIIWGLCFCLFGSNFDLVVKALCGILITSILTLIQVGIITSISLHSRVKNVGVIPLTILMSWIPCFMGLLATISTSARPVGMGLLLFSPFSWMGATQLSLLNICMVAIAQIGILAALTKSLAGEVKSLGRVENRPIERHQTPTLTETS